MRPCGYRGRARCWPSAGGTIVPGSWHDPSVAAGWKCLVLSPSADPEDWTIGGIELEQLDPGAAAWFASGPCGEHVGGLAEVLAAVADAEADPAWLDVVVAVITADSDGERRSWLVVSQGRGVWFHTTFVENRASIRAHGLDWRRFAGSGIAGSQAPETDGIFLCSEIESAEWFAQMGRRRGREVDIWAVALDGRWLISDPGSSGGLDDGWMICLDPIPPRALELRVPGQPG